MSFKWPCRTDSLEQKRRQKKTQVWLKLILIKNCAVMVVVFVQVNLTKSLCYVMLVSDVCLPAVFMPTRTGHVYSPKAHSYFHPPGINVFFRAMTSLESTETRLMWEFVSAYTSYEQSSINLFSLWLWRNRLSAYVKMFLSTLHLLVVGATDAYSL